MKKRIAMILMAAVTVSLWGCAKHMTPPQAPSTVLLPAQEVPLGGSPETISPEQEAAALTRQPPAAPVIPAAEASGEQAQRCDRAEIDHSHAEQGYVMARFTAETASRLKALVRGPSATYQYNLTPGEWAVLPLSDGDGSYEISIYENVAGNQYAKVLTARREVVLEDPFAPFLRPNQYVSYSESTAAVAKGLSLTEGLTEPLEKVEAIYDFVVGSFQYDYEKAATVQSGYLPVLDDILAQKKGICFDYAALMTAMLRSQQIPCKMVIGYAGSTYHAWISVWTEESGWVDGVIFFDGQKWQRMDPTFASTSEGSQEILDFIQNGNYQVKYLY